MTNLTQAKQLMLEGKFREAIKYVNAFEEEKNLTLQDQYEVHYLKSILFLEVGYMDQALECVELAYQESKQLKDKLLIVDALINKRLILGKCAKPDEELKTIKEIEQTLYSITQNSSIEFKERSATLMLEKGGYYFNIGEFNRSLKYCSKGLSIAKEIKNQELIMQAKKLFSFNYYLKGDIELSHEYVKKYLAIARKLNDKQEMIAAFNGFGMYFTDKGEFDQAANYLEQSLALCLEIDSFKTIVILSSLFDLYFYTNSFEKAQNCLKNMKQFIEDHSEFKASSTFYHIANAMMLKRKPQKKAHLKAKQILKQIIDVESPFSELYYIALIHLSDTYLILLRETDDLKLLDEINPYITQLKNIAKTQHSFWVLVETLILQAKLKLITFEFRNAQKLLSKALDVAERYSLDRLANRILYEQNELSKNYIKWEKLKASGANMSERMDLAHMEEQIEILLQKRKYLRNLINQSK